MTGLLIYVKHNLPFLWSIIEWVNSLLFNIIYRSKIEKEAENQLSRHKLNPYTLRKLTSNDLSGLQALLLSQREERIKYFQPHDFDKHSLAKVFQNHSLLLLGVFHESKMVGYFFLRCFINKKCFVGRLVDESHSNQGIGKTMNQIMYNTGWNCGFKVLSTISQNNHLVIRSHRNNKHLLLIKELPTNYQLVEFRR